jgi:arylformamidase
VKVHDVSLALRPGMPTWPGEDGPAFTPLRRIARGDGANVSVVTFSNHTGTHVDPPSHFLEGGKPVDQLPVDALVGPCVVVTYDEDEHIGASWLEGAGIEPGTERVLFKTRNSERWRSGEPFAKEFIALDRSGAEWCVQRRLRLVGVDYLSVEPFGSGKIGHPVHVALLGAGVVIVEGLDLSGVAAGRYELVCGPLKLEGSDGAPARVFLIER